MPVIKVNTEGDNAWVDLRDRFESGDPTLIQAMGDGTVWELILLKGGMQSGKPSVGLRLDLPDGRVVVAETSWQAFLAAAGVLQAKISQSWTAI
mgnify:CR=1 FL=1